MPSLKSILYNLTDLFLRIFVYPFIRFVWVGEAEGLQNIPRKGGIILASNHESYFDFICLSAVSPRAIRFLTAEVFFKKWWWRLIVVLTRQIKIDRYGKNRRESARRATKKAIMILRKGEVFGIYPEGTRSSDGKLQRAFTGVARIALAARVPVIPVAMIGTYEIMSRYEKRPHFRKCRIRVGKPLNFSAYYGQEDNKKILRKITNEIMHEIGQLTGEEYKFD